VGVRVGKKGVNGSACTGLQKTEVETLTARVDHGIEGLVTCSTAHRGIHL